MKVLALLVSTCLVSTQATWAADLSPPRPGLSLAFSDEFEAGRLSTARWSTAFHDGARTHGPELQAYLPDEGPASPFSFHDGALRIEARPSEPGARSPGITHASGMISSHPAFSFRYGYAEVRARIPAGQGLWPAFWLFDPSTERYAEIDVMEVLGHEPGKLYSTTHSGPKWEGRRIDQAETDVPPLSDDFHVYAVDWGPDFVTFLLDGKVTGKFETTPELRHPMHLMVNLAVGGEWAGPPDATTPIPATMDIDYVRVWKEAP